MTLQHPTPHPLPNSPVSCQPPQPTNSIHPFCFHTLAHSFAPFICVKPFIFYNLRTLLHGTGGGGTFDFPLDCPKTELHTRTWPGRLDVRVNSFSVTNVLETLSFQNGGVKLHAVAAGPIDGPVILLLHGF